MNILVTGGAGFIGSKVVSELLKRGMNVRISSRKMQSIVGVDCVKVDLLNSEVDLDFLVSDCTVILNCLGELQDESKMHALHVEATERLIIAAKRSARQSGMPVHWVQLSSVGAYGPVLEKANSERIVTEETASAPVGVYECTKTIADELVMSSVENGVFSYSILRPSNVYGSGMPNGSLRQWARLIKAHCFFYVGPPGSVSTYVHVDDVVEALLLCAFEERAKNQIFNISNDCTQESLAGW